MTTRKADDDWVLWNDALLLAKADPRFGDAIWKTEIQPILDVEGVGESEGPLEESQLGL